MGLHVPVQAPVASVTPGDCLGLTACNFMAQKYNVSFCQHAALMKALLIYSGIQHHSPQLSMTIMRQNVLFFVLLYVNIAEIIKLLRTTWLQCSIEALDSIIKVNLTNYIYQNIQQGI